MTSTIRARKLVDDDTNKPTTTDGGGVKDGDVKSSTGVTVRRWLRWILWAGIAATTFWFFLLAPAKTRVNVYYTLKERYYLAFPLRMTLAELSKYGVFFAPVVVARNDRRHPRNHAQIQRH